MEAEPEPLRVVIWGAGYFGRKWLHEVQRNGDCALLGVISRSRDRVSGLVRELSLDPLAAFDGPADARNGGAEAVIIALPQMLHRDAAVAALDAGLHVILEKPLAMSLDEARVIVKRASASPDRVFMVTQNFRWRPHALAMRKAVLGGVIGRVANVFLECRQAIKRSTTEAWRERMDDPYLADFAIHHFDLIRYVTGLEVEEVFATSFHPPGSWFDGRSAAAAILKMSGGAVVSYQGTMVTPGAVTTQEGLVTIVGESGALRLDGKHKVILSGAGDPITLPEPPVPDGELAHGLRELVDSIRSKRRPETDVADNFKSFAALMAAMESAATGKAVRVATT
jgi:predicted dehydrogenase